MRTAAFVLPEGYALGGTTTWSLQMCKLLQRRGVKSFILEHTTDENHYKSMEHSRNTSFLTSSVGADLLTTIKKTI